MGNNRGLFWSENGIPENQTGGRLEGMAELGVTLTGMTVAGVSLSGKCERRGVPGGGKTSENSGAREVRGVCFGETAMRRLVFFSKRLTND